MSYIITIARQFSSGGREFGRRLAEELKIAYYDKEILDDIAKKTEYSIDYIQEVSENRPIVLPPINYGHSFSLYQDVSMQQTIDIHTMQSEIITQYADKSDCVIIGRGADYTLRDKKPYRIFVYADLESRIKRCRNREGNEHLSDKELKKMILRIDKKRRDYYEYYTGMKWGEKENYDLLINTSNLDLKDLAHTFATLILKDQKNK